MVMGNQRRHTVAYSRKKSRYKLQKYNFSDLGLLNADQGDLVSMLPKKRVSVLNILYLPEIVQLSSFHRQEFFRMAREVQQVYEPRGEPAKVTRIVRVWNQTQAAPSQSGQNLRRIGWAH
jgi:hypothetical protein